MNILVNYAGGTCGDFIRLCLTVGAPTKKFKISHPNIKSIVRGEEHIIAHINLKGRMRIMYSNHGSNLRYQMNSWADANRFHTDGSLINQLHNKEISIDEYLEIHKNNIQNTRNKMWYTNYADSDISVGSGHEIYKFWALFNNLDYYHKFLDVYEIDKVVWISFNETREFYMRKTNELKKNGVRSDTSRKDKYLAREISLGISDNMRPEDYTIKLADIYNKDSLRKSLKEIYPDWKDTYFDDLYDIYMLRQDIIGERQ